LGEKGLNTTKIGLIHKTTRLPQQRSHDCDQLAHTCCIRTRMSVITLFLATGTSSASDSLVAVLMRSILFWDETLLWATGGRDEDGG
jgi:hypothetical protein